MSPGTSPASYPLEVLYTQAADAARTGAPGFFFATKFFPPDLARAAHAIYWYCEYTRSFVRQAETSGQDSRSLGQANLDRWASMVAAGLRGHLARHPVLDVFLDTVERCQIPGDYPQELIEGYRMELTHARYESFSQLLEHCRRRGGMVSMMMAHVVGYRDPALDYMADLGVAADLTANLRDVGEHLSRGYISIPLEEMRAFNYTEANLESHIRNAAFESLMRYQADRVHSYYQKAEPGLGLLDERGRFAVRVAFDLYRKTLRRIEASGFDVFRRRPAVPAMSRYWITARSMAGPITRRLWKGKGA
ncbi:MAG TPA: phytoene/squalene synthase family protein [Bryobacteraceae bacterium]|jgi:phytoene synthase